MATNHLDDITRDHRVAWLGTTSVADTGGALRPSRVPPAASYQLAPTTAFVAQMCSGVRLGLRTDATHIQLTSIPTRAHIDDFAPDPARFDLVIDGEVVDTAATEAGRVVHINTDDPAALSVTDNGIATTTFTDLPPGPKSIEVWLPHAGQIEVHRVAISTGATIDPPERRPRWIHYGSSISHCIEADRPTNTWPAVAALATNLNLTNLGFAGECHIDQSVARYIRDAQADLVSLKLGINTLYTLKERTLTSAVHGFLDTVRDKHPHTPIAICSPILCPDHEDGAMTTQSPTRPPDTPCPTPEIYLPPLTACRVREVLADVVATRQAQGDNKLHYINGLDLFGPTDIDDLPDRIHPSPRGYVRIGQRFATRVLGPSGPLSVETD